MSGAVRFGSAEWAAALADEINGSSEYRNAAAQWGVGFNGDILLEFKADGGSSAPRSLLVRLAGGACQGAEFVDPAAAAASGFGLEAPFLLWKEILERRTLAATAILTGRMKVRGDKTILLRHIAAHRALIHCAASLDTRFE